VKFVVVRSADWKEARVFRRLPAVLPPGWVVLDDDVRAESLEEAGRWAATLLFQRQGHRLVEGAGLVPRQPN
jgi:hypothetical protein